MPTLKHYIFFLICMGAAFANPSYSQDQVGDSDKQRMVGAIQGYEEMIYIHTDRNFYLTGEFVKFKVYCLERGSHQPTRLSKVAYVEIYDQERSNILQARIELNNGTGYGEIYIPTSINSSNFIIRGYTRWMQNWGPGAYFHAYLTVLNPFKRPWLKDIPQDEDFLVLYPEGGDLIDKKPGRIIYYPNVTKSKFQEFTGKLVINDSITAAEFKPEPSGLGSFEFNVEKDKTYSIQIVDAEGNLHTQPIPEIKETGLSLRLAEKAGMFQVDVFCNDPAIFASSGEINCQVQQKGHIIRTEKLFFKDQVAEFDLDKDVLAEGVFKVILRGKQGEVLRELLGFKYTEDLRSTKLNITTNTYKPRSLVKFDLPSVPEASDQNDFEVSISVSSANTFDKYGMVNLAEFLLLDNYGTLHPALTKSLEGSMADISASINNLLVILSNSGTESPGFRKVFKNTFLPEYRAPLFEGKIINKETNQPANNVLGFLSAIGKSNLFYVAKSEPDGTVCFELRNFYGNHDMVVQCFNDDETLYSIELKPAYSTEYLETVIPELALDEAMSEWLTRQSQNMQVEFVYRKYNPGWTMEDPTISEVFYGRPNASYMLDDYTRFPVMEEVMREYISGILVRKNSDGFRFIVNDPDLNVNYEEGPLILLDGVPIFDADDIMALDPLKVQKIETVRGKFGKGYLNCYGIVAYSSYKGDMGGYTLPADVLKLQVDGLQIRKNYLYPAYDDQSDVRSRIPDFRNSLYWKPSLGWKENKEDVVQFYTSDDTNDYVIEINGINNIGQPFSATATFNVDN